MYDCVCWCVASLLAGVLQHSPRQIFPWDLKVSSYLDRQTGSSAERWQISELCHLKNTHRENLLIINKMKINRPDGRACWAGLLWARVTICGSDIHDGGTQRTAEALQAIHTDLIILPSHEVWKAATVDSLKETSPSSASLTSWATRLLSLAEQKQPPSPSICWSCRGRDWQIVWHCVSSSGEEVHYPDCGPAVHQTGGQLQGLTSLLMGLYHREEILQRHFHIWGSSVSKHVFFCVSYCSLHLHFEQ